MIKQGTIFIIDNDACVVDWLSHNSVIDDAFIISERLNWLDPQDAPHLVVVWNGTRFEEVKDRWGVDKSARTDSK